MWWTAGLPEDRTSSILGPRPAGAFLLQTTEDGVTTLSLRVPEDQGAPLVRHLLLKRHRTFVHLERSPLLFDDVFKLVSFYCVSRDILPVPLRLPRAVTTGTRREELESVCALGPDFWTSDLSQQDQNQNQDQDQHQHQNQDQDQDQEFIPRSRLVWLVSS